MGGTVGVCGLVDESNIVYCVACHNAEVACAITRSEASAIKATITH